MQAKKILIIAIVACLLITQFSDISAKKNKKQKKPKQNKEDRQGVLEAPEPEPQLAQGIFNSVDDDEDDEEEDETTKTTKKSTKKKSRMSGTDDTSLLEELATTVLGILGQFLIDLFLAFIECAASGECELASNGTVEQCFSCVNATLPPFPEVVFES